MFELDDEFNVDEAFLEEVFSTEQQTLTSVAPHIEHHTKTTQHTGPNPQPVDVNTEQTKHMNCGHNVEDNFGIQRSNLVQNVSTKIALAVSEVDINSRDASHATALSLGSENVGKGQKPETCIGNMVRRSNDAVLRLLRNSPSVIDKRKNEFEHSDAQGPARVQNGRHPAEPMRPRRICQRKFPGPAGLLPERRGDTYLLESTELLSELEADARSLPQLEENVALSQGSSAVFEEEPWLHLLQDLGGVGTELLGCFNVASVKRKAAARQLTGCKVPFLAVVLQHVDPTSPDPCVILRDQTGEMHGTLHRAVWEQFGNELTPGCVLALKNVGVLTTGANSRKHYLNITANNLTTLYSVPPSHSQGGELSVTRFNPMTSRDFIQTIEDWRAMVIQSPVNMVPSPFCPTNIAPRVGLFSPTTSSSVRDVKVRPSTSLVGKPVGKAIYQGTATMQNRASPVQFRPMASSSLPLQENNLLHLQSQCSNVVPQQPKNIISELYSKENARVVQNACNSQDVFLPSEMETSDRFQRSSMGMNVSFNTAEKCHISLDKTAQYHIEQVNFQSATTLPTDLGQSGIKFQPKRPRFALLPSQVFTNNSDSILFASQGSTCASEMGALRKCTPSGALNSGMVILETQSGHSQSQISINQDNNSIADMTLDGVDSESLFGDF